MRLWNVSSYIIRKNDVSSSSPWIQDLHVVYEDKICSEHVPHSSESTPNSKCVLSQVTPYLRLQKAMLRNNTKVNTKGTNSIDANSNKADRKIKPNSKLIVFLVKCSQPDTRWLVGSCKIWSFTKGTWMLMLACWAISHGKSQSWPGETKYIVVYISILDL